MQSPSNQVLSAKEAINNCMKGKWYDHLFSLSLSKQWKFEDINDLENESHSWKKIMQSGLPNGQISFLLKAGSDTLPQPTNFKEMEDTL